MDIQFTEPCLGSVGSQPFLDDVQNQLNENRNAKLAGREPVILPIQCRLCSGYHEANQLDASSVFKGTEYESYAYDRIAPPPNDDTYIPSDLLVTAHLASGNGDPFSVDPTGIEDTPPPPADNGEEPNADGTE